MKVKKGQLWKMCVNDFSFAMIVLYVLRGNNGEEKERLL
jgi:hypothetical protein